MSEPVPSVEVTPARRSFMSRASVVWLVPLAALVIALGVAWQAWVDQGPLIEIYFTDAAGVTVNETELRYRDVAVGLVEKVTFAEGLDRVVVSVRLQKEVAPYVDGDARFWVVRPEVTTQGISGLDTVLSGVYLAGQWNTEADGLAGPFDGLSDPPLLTGDQEGLRIFLRSTGGTLTGNTPLLYKGVEVGRVGSAQVSPDGFSVEAQSVIYTPYDNLITRSTRFWDTSGFTFSIGTGGAEVDFDSVASLLAGGLTFDTFISGSELAQDGDTFDVYDDDAAARASVFNAPEGSTITLSALFEGNAAGLGAGSPVELDGLRVGQVTALNGLVDEQRFGDRNVRLQVLFDVQPERLGFEGEGADQLTLTFFNEQVAQGLRARLATGNLLTGGLKVQLVTVDDAPVAQMAEGPDSYPMIPTTESDITDVAGTAESTLARIDALPIEGLMQSAIGFLDNATLLVGSDAIQQTPEELRGLLSDIRGITASADVQALPAQLGATMAELQTSVERVSAILAQVEEQDTVARLLAAVDGVTAVTAEVNTAIAGVPDLLTQVQAVAAKADALPIEDLLTQVQGLAASASALVGSDATQALPAQVGLLADELSQAVNQAQTLLAGVNEGDGVERLLAAVDAAGATARTLDTSLAGVPALIERIDALAAKATDLPLDQLITEATAVLASADTLIGSEETRAVPGKLVELSNSLQGTLAEARSMLADLNEGGASASLLRAIDNANATIDTVNSSVAGVPDLVAQLDDLAARAQTLPIEDLLDRVTEVADAAAVILQADSTQALPQSLNGALDQLRMVLMELREGGTVENANATLASARAAADQIAAAAQSLPGLLSRTTALLDQAGGTLAGFEDTSPAIRDARTALREVSQAAEAVGSLARALERRPNSLLLGR